MPPQSLLPLFMAALAVACTNKAADSDIPPDDYDQRGDSDDARPDLVFEFTGDRPKNLLMISLDTTRRDFVGRFSGDDSTPRIDALLERSYALDNHRSCSNWTFASVACVQSGQRPTESGFVPATIDVRPVPEDLGLASDLLQRAGFQTALVSSNVFFSAETRLDRGFEQVWHQPADANVLNALAFSG